MEGRRPGGASCAAGPRREIPCGITEQSLMDLDFNQFRFGFLLHRKGDGQQTLFQAG